MSELFLSVLNMSLTASYIILFVIFVRLLLKKAPKVISYALWGVVAFRLIIPFSFESIFSLLPRNTNTVLIPHDIIYQQTPQINSGIEVVDSFVSESLPGPIVGASANVSMELLSNPVNNGVIMVNDILYLQSRDTVNELPPDTYEIGMLESILHNRKEIPERKCQGAMLDEKYSGNFLYQSKVQDGKLYLKDLSGYYIVFVSGDEVIFNRYLDEITGVDRDDVKAIDVNILKDGNILKSYFDKEESYLMLDFLHEVKSLGQEKDGNEQGPYAYRVRTAIETSESIYEIIIDVDETNYDFRINEITVDMNENKKIELTRYFKSNDKSIALMKELFSFMSTDSNGIEPTNIKPTVPELSLEQTIGVDMVELDYASDDIVIFTIISDYLFMTLIYYKLYVAST